MRYILKADALLKERHQSSRAKAIRLGLARREVLYALAVKERDVRGALAVLADEAKLRVCTRRPRTWMIGRRRPTVGS